MVDIKNVKKDGKFLPTGKECDLLAKEVKGVLDSLMYDAPVVIPTKNRCSIKVGNVTLSSDFIAKNGHNVNSFSGRRGRYLSWDQWIDLHNGISDLFDKKGLSASISTDAKKYVIRDENGRKSEEDWESAKHENAGSMSNPIPRYKLWLPERSK